MVVAFYGLIIQFENAFSVVAVQFLEEDRQRDILGSSPHDPETKKGWILVAQGNEATFMASTDSSTLKKHVPGPQQQPLTSQSPGSMIFIVITFKFSLSLLIYIPGNKLMRRLEMFHHN